ncbi:hypothetical protein [Bdellovibrio sp. HCB274]|uniref:hypothetical protein n=1 Tax=Bdellovibrio sp. HCB274 TaxID=3394361 RepID=UPI0039B59117
MNYYRAITVAAILGITFTTGLKLTLSAPEESQQDLASKSLQDIRNNLGSNNLFDGVFYYKAQNLNGKYDIHPFRIKEVFYNDQAGYGKAVNLYNASFGVGSNGIPAARSYNESVRLAQDYGSRLNLPEKLAYLSFLGSRLSDGYSSATENESDMQKIFENALNHKLDGGICGDIHRYLSDHAKALGFDNVGLHSGIWQKDSKGKQGDGHLVYHFRDPSSGIYFIQNYSQLVNTGQNTVQGAVDVSTRILGPISGVSQVESSERRNKYHAYLPKTSRWVQANLKGFTEMQEDDPIVRLKVSNEGTTAGLQFTKDLGKGTKARGFIMHSDFDTRDGRFEMNAVGFAMQNQFSVPLANSIIDEYGMNSNVYGGVMQIRAPSFDSKMNPMDKTRNTLIMGVKVKGYARVNKTTGRIEVETFSNDMGLQEQSGSVDARTRVGVNQNVGESPFSVDAEREFELSRKSQKEKSNTLQTHFDKVSLIYDSTKNGSKAYLVLNSEYYVFEGVEAFAASAVRQVIKVSFPAAQFGTISFAVDASRFVSNKSGDAYYNNPFAASMKVAIEKAVNKFVSVGAGMEYNNKNRAYWVMDPDITPEINKAKGLSGFIWVSAKI